MSNAPRRVPVPAGTLLADGELALPPGPRHHVLNVLRLGAGAALVLFDGAGTRADAVLLEDGRVRVTRVESCAALPPPRVTLLCGLSKADKVEVILEKACEAGADAVWPVETARSVVKLDADRAASRLERWERIAQAASRQSGRDHVLHVHAPTTLEKALPAVAAIHRRVLVPGDAPALSRSLPEDVVEDVALLTGPEGGLAPQEVELAERHGFTRASLGPFVLRAETAPLVGLAAVMARAGRA